MPPPQGTAPPSAPPSRQDIEDLIRLLAKQHQVDPDLALSIAEVESNFEPKARSKKGARGVMQLMPATAKTYGVQNPDDLDDPAINIRAGMQYLRALDIETQGHPTTVARRYVGSPRLPPERSDFYVRRVFDAYRKRMGLPPDLKNVDTDGRVPAPPVDDDEVDTQRGHVPQPPPAGAAAGPGAPPAPGSWAAYWQRHPYQSAFVDALDPHERSGRQNIVGGIGSVLGGLAGGLLGGGGGAVAGTAVEPGGGTVAGATAGAIWGRRLGSGVGAALGGGLEQAVVEETGLGALLSKLPWGTQDEPTPPPDPHSTLRTRVEGAGTNQARQDLLGQALLVPARILGKRIVQTSLGKSAAEALEQARAAASETFTKAKIGLGEQVRAVREQGRVAMADLKARIAARMEQLRVDELNQNIRPARAAKLATEDAGKAEAARLAAEHDALIEAARAKAEAAVKGASTAREAELAAVRAGHEGNLAAAAPSAQAAGRSVADIFEDAATAARRTRGAAVDEAAESGPFKDFKALKAEADRIDREQLLPRTFPNQQASAVVDRIRSEPDVISFPRLHQIKKELQDALRNTYDKAARSQIQGVLIHLTKQIRETLSGYAPYDAATKAYEDIIPRYTTQLAQTIRRAARGAPEEIAQMIHIDKPTQAGFLTKLMTEAAAEGGDAAGGRKALEGVQDVWFYTNVLEGDLATLGDRLAAIKRRPDFVKAFLSDPRMKALIARTEQFAKEYPELQAMHDAAVAATKAAGEAGVEAAQAAKDAALAGHGAKTLQEIRQATAKVAEAIDKKNATKATAKAATTAEKEALRRASAAKTEEAVQAKATATSPELDRAVAEQRKLAQSTLGSKNLRTPAQMGADALSVLRGGVFKGIGLMRWMLGASDADIARYVIYGSQPIRTITKALVTSTLHPLAPAAASQVGVKPWVGSKLEPTNHDLYLTIGGDKKSSPPPPPPPAAPIRR